MNTEILYERSEIGELSHKLADAAADLYKGFLSMATMAGMDSPEPYANYCMMSMCSNIMEHFSTQSTKHLDKALEKMINAQKVDL
jgi:hypothetical protein